MQILGPGRSCPHGPTPPYPRPRKTDVAGDLARRIDAVIEAGTSASTRRPYTRDLKYFGAWYTLSQGESLALPVSVDSVMQFILDHTQAMPESVECELLARSLKSQPGPISVRSIRRYLSSMSVAHLEQGEASPVRDERVKLLLRRAQRARRAERPHQKAAITADILRALLATCDESLRGVRDRAILLVGFASGARRAQSSRIFASTTSRESTRAICCTSARARPIKMVRDWTCPW